MAKIWYLLLASMADGVHGFICVLCVSANLAAECLFMSTVSEICCSDLIILAYAMQRNSPVLKCVLHLFH